MFSSAKVCKVSPWFFSAVIGGSRVHGGLIKVKGIKTFPAMNPPLPPHNLKHFSVCNDACPYVLSEKLEDYHSDKACLGGEPFNRSFYLPQMGN